MYLVKIDCHDKSSKNQNSHNNSADLILKIQILFVQIFMNNTLKNIYFIENNELIQIVFLLKHKISDFNLTKFPDNSFFCSGLNNSFTKDYS